MREADLRVSEDAFGETGVAELFSLARQAGLVDLDELACHGTSAVIRVEVDQRIEADSLDALSYVDNWQHIAEAGDSHVYVIAFTAPDLPGRLADSARSLIGTCDPDVDERGVSLSLTGPQAAISETVEGYERAGVSPDLEALGDYEPAGHPVEELTDRQREVIETAWEMGYYEVPKQVSADDVATEMSLDSSTVNEHLQRAERNLLGQIL